VSERPHRHCAGCGYSITDDVGRRHVCLDIWRRTAHTEMSKEIQRLKERVAKLELLVAEGCPPASS